VENLGAAICAIENVIALIGEYQAWRARHAAKISRIGAYKML
jgi:hypothetical protein